jgi:hypothetical protein
LEICVTWPNCACPRIANAARIANTAAIAIASRIVMAMTRTSWGLDLRAERPCASPCAPAGERLVAPACEGLAAYIPACLRSATSLLTRLHFCVISPFPSLPPSASPHHRLKLPRTTRSDLEANADVIGAIPTELGLLNALTKLCVRAHANRAVAARATGRRLRARTVTDPHSILLACPSSPPSPAPPPLASPAGPDSA